jgi:peptidoglycan/xylan/chitin deacetylase (PgdA/CDA1 family)
VANSYASSITTRLVMTTRPSKPVYLAASQKIAAKTSALELVLNLHGVGTPPDGIDNNSSRYWVPRQTFTTLLDSIVVANATSNVPILITFDDGNASDAVIALPELAKRRLRAAFFVPANRIGAAHYLDRVALADLIAAGMEIGTADTDHRDGPGSMRPHLTSS